MTIAMAEFTTIERCELAGAAAARKFRGALARPYWVCVEK